MTPTGISIRTVVTASICYLTATTGKPDSSLWVRQSRPYAGDTYGLHPPLLAGTGGGDYFEDATRTGRRIAGVLHDSAHGDHVTIRN